MTKPVVVTLLVLSCTIWGSGILVLKDIVERWLGLVLMPEAAELKILGMYIVDPCFTDWLQHSTDILPWTLGSAPWVEYNIYQNMVSQAARTSVILSLSHKGMQPHVKSQHIALYDVPCWRCSIQHALAYHHACSHIPIHHQVSPQQLSTATPSTCQHCIQ